MKAALFFEDNQLCHLGENIGKKAIKVSTLRQKMIKSFL